MTDKNLRQVKTKEEAITLANKIAKYAIRQDFKPFSFVSDFGAKRTKPQNDYYWGGVVTLQFEHFKGNIVAFAQWVFKALQQQLTPELIHELNKILYNNGQSTTKIAKDNFVEVFIKPLRDDMLHYGGLIIDLPPENDNYGNSTCQEA